jgi:hypothetical protein
LYSLKHVVPSGSGGTSTLLESTLRSYGRFAVYFASFPTTRRVFYGSNLTGNILSINPDGTLYHGGLAVSGTTALSTGRWYVIGWRMVTGTSVACLTIDGATEITGSPGAISGAQTRVGCNDTVAAGFTVYYADLRIDDSAIPSGLGKVPLLLPTSDNARNGWTGGVGGTTNLFQAVDNTPPVGTDTETDTTQIESATNSATDDCDFNMTTYSAAGIGASDTINAVQALCVHGEDITTGTKAGALKIVSNPAQSVEDTFNYGNDAGALGVYPTLWTVTQGTTQDAPTISSLSTAPVLRIGKRTATTRVVSCCFMGMYVDYTPGATTKAPPPYAGTHRPQFRTPKRRSV